jgi:hypothetical protein
VIADLIGDSVVDDGDMIRRAGNMAVRYFMRRRGSGAAIWPMSICCTSVILPCERPYRPHFRDTGATPLYSSFLELVN